MVLGTFAETKVPPAEGQSIYSIPRCKTSLNRLKNHFKNTNNFYVRNISFSVKMGSPISADPIKKQRKTRQFYFVNESSCNDSFN